ncbi:MAG: prepilin-type N-terminal cleavage/methylation domain-containing protein [Verrucomicrobiota bacterium]
MKSSQPINFKAHAKHGRGFTLLECMIVLAIISLLAAITVPSLVRARTTSQMNDCKNNLRQVDSAVQQWALEANAGIGTPVNAVNIRPYLGRGASGSMDNVFCPADPSKLFDNSYTLTDTGTKPACQIVPAGTGAHIIE